MALHYILSITTPSTWRSTVSPPLTAGTMGLAIAPTAIGITATGKAIAMTLTQRDANSTGWNVVVVTTR